MMDLDNAVKVSNPNDDSNPGDDSYTDEQHNTTETNDTKTKKNQKNTFKNITKPPPTLADETGNKPILSLRNLKSHTKKWTSLSQQAKNTMPYISSDRQKALQDLEKCLPNWPGFDINEATKDHWASAFNKSYKARKNQKGGPINIFGRKLAGTRPTELFLDSEFDGTSLFGSPLANAWAGAYIFYGPVWEPHRLICLDISNGPAPPTNMWNNLSKDVTTNSSPFRPSEIFADNPRSMHDLERHLRTKLNLARSPVEIDPHSWSKASMEYRDNHEVFSTIVKLALTPISVFRKDMFSDHTQKQLMASAVAHFWVGAYHLLGAPWAQAQTHAKTPHLSPPRISRSPQPIAKVTSPPKVHNLSPATAPPLADVKSAKANGPLYLSKSLLTAAKSVSFGANSSSPGHRVNSHP